MKPQPEEIKANLAAQIDHPVRWEESIGRLVADGYDTFVEVGAGTVLAGLMKRLAPECPRLQRRRQRRRAGVYGRHQAGNLSSLSQNAEKFIGRVLTSEGGLDIVVNKPE